MAAAVAAAAARVRKSEDLDANDAKEAVGEEESGDGAGSFMPRKTAESRIFGNYREPIVALRTKAL